MNKLIVVSGLLLMISFAYGEPGPEIPDGRRHKKPLSSSQTTSSANSLSKTNDAAQKTSPAPSTTKQSKDKSVVSSQLPTTVFVQTPPPVQTQQNVPVSVLQNYPSQGIFMSMGNPGVGRNPYLAAQAPMLMQYMTPQGQIQYVHILRPFMIPYPIAPQYIPAQLPQLQTQINTQSTSAYTNTAPQGFQPVTPDVLLPTPVPFYPTPSPSFTTSSSAPPPSSFIHFQPSAQHGSYSNPYTLYASQNRVQLINAPSDLSLNTNEYMPSSSNNVYKTIKPLRS